MAYEENNTVDICIESDRKMPFSDDGTAGERDEELLSTWTDAVVDEEDADENNALFPDWQLIDEISIRLLEQGIGTFETLQRALPSVALARIQQILPDDHEQHEHQQHANDDGIYNTNPRCCGATRMVKLFRLAQLQIDYLLKTQQGLVERIEKTEQKCRRWRRENRAMREQFCRGQPSSPAQQQQQPPAIDENQKKKQQPQQQQKNKPHQQNRPTTLEEEGGAAQWGRELFRCNECTKLFLHANFLAEHIQRRHNGQLESAARLSSVKARIRSGRVVLAGGGMEMGGGSERTAAWGGGANELTTPMVASALTSSAAAADQSSQQQQQQQHYLVEGKKAKSMKRKNAVPKRGQSHESDTYPQKQHDQQQQQQHSNSKTKTYLPRQHSQQQHGPLQSPSFNNNNEQQQQSASARPFAM